MAANSPPIGNQGVTVLGGTVTIDPTGLATDTNQGIQIIAEQGTQAGVGATTDAAATVGSNGSLNAKLRLATTQLASIITNTTSYVLAAGTAIIGKVGIDQTAPGTTDSVTVKNQKVGATTVVGITEVRSLATGLTAATTTVASGGLSVSMAFSSDFAGSISVSGGSDQTWAGADGPYVDSAQPGNLLPTYVIKRSAGTYKVAIGTPT